MVITTKNLTFLLGAKLAPTVGLPQQFSIVISPISILPTGRRMKTGDLGSYNADSES